MSAQERIHVRREPLTRDEPVQGHVDLDREEPVERQGRRLEDADLLAWRVDIEGVDLLDTGEHLVEHRPGSFADSNAQALEHCRVAWMDQRDRHEVLDPRPRLWKTLVR